MSCRFMDANGNGSREQAIKCMDWCLKQDVHVISNSWGEVPISLSLQVCAGLCSWQQHRGRPPSARQRPPRSGPLQ
jgi:hypothetical protein